MIWAVILAAGESRRMGEPKQLLPYGRSTVLETVIENVLRSAADKALVVLGASSPKIRPLAARHPVAITRNPRYRSGMLSSVQWAFGRLPRQTQAALIFLGDQPWISPQTADRLIAVYRRTGKGLILPAYRNKGGHPLLIDLKYRRAVARLDREIGLRQLFSLYPADVVRIPVRNAEILADLDSPEDYRGSISRRGPKS